MSGETGRLLSSTPITLYGLHSHQLNPVQHLWVICVYACVCVSVCEMCKTASCVSYLAICPAVFPLFGEFI